LRRIEHGVGFGTQVGHRYSDDQYTQAYPNRAVQPVPSTPEP
jgi:hypothetical protein